MNKSGSSRFQAKILPITIVVFMAVFEPAFAQSPLAAAATSPAVAASEEKKASAWDAPEPWRTDRFFFGTSFYTHHFHYDPAHNDNQNLIFGEWNINENWLVGGAMFDNSYSQETQYVYGGYRFRPLQSVQPFYVKLSAGLIHGYKGEYQNKIPLNSTGIAPVIVPALGYCFNRLCSELVLFGAAGVMATFGVTLP